MTIAVRYYFLFLIHRFHGLHAPHRGVVGLAHLGQVEGLTQCQLGHHVRPEDLGQRLGDGDEHRDLAAADLIYKGLGLASLASSFHVDESVATRASWLFEGK